jgi:D-threonine aldolase
MRLADIPTPALLIEADALDRNLTTMAAALPGARLRPHVKAHKCTALAKEQARHGHLGFTCATPREVVGMAAAGLGDDLLLANETLDSDRLRAMAACGARVTVAIDSVATLDAARAAGIGEVVIDVNVGLPRCGIDVASAGALADQARRAGLGVRGIMGYEGHLVVLDDRDAQRRGLVDVTGALRTAHEAVGGELVSTGGTGTYDLHTDLATEIQAGSYALMDTAYAKLGLPFEQALFVLATVVSVSPGWAVCDAGLKSLGMDHGNPSIAGASVWFCSDEHVTFSGLDDVAAGDRVRLLPAHIDPTVAMHERAYVARGDDVVDVWPIDLRGW